MDEDQIFLQKLQQARDLGWKVKLVHENRFIIVAPHNHIATIKNYASIYTLIKCFDKEYLVPDYF